MEKVTKPHNPDNKKYIFTEGVNYFETGKPSIWGTGDKATLELLDKEEITGKWLNLAAGDGRYNLNLLKKADFIVASDIDESALSKLWHTTPEEYRNKLEITVFDITKPFPFEDNSFDGIFCAGTLHLFPRDILRKIVNEIDRVLKPDGKIVIDFATDIKRISLEGKSIRFGDEPLYAMDEAKELLKELFKRYKIRMHESDVPEEVFLNAKPPYKFSCKFVLLIGKKGKA